MLFSPNIMPFNLRMQGQQSVKLEKSRLLLIKVLLTGATMTDYRENGKFWSEPYENEILIKLDR